MTTNHLYYKKIERKPCTYKTTFSTEYFRGKSKVLMCFGFLIFTTYSSKLAARKGNRENFVSFQHNTQPSGITRGVYHSHERRYLPACRCDLLYACIWDSCTTDSCITRVMCVRAIHNLVAIHKLKSIVIKV